jgi:hypothetical protein
MVEFGVVALILMAAIGGVLLLAGLALVARALIWLVLLPVKLVFGLLLLPFLLIKLLLTIIFGVIVVPIVAVIAVVGAVVGIVAAFTVGTALAIPLAPFLLFAAVIFWLLKKDKPASTLPVRSV